MTIGKFVASHSLRPTAWGFSLKVHGSVYASCFVTLLAALGSQMRAQTITTTGLLNQARYLHSATPLADGTILVAGPEPGE